MTNTSSNFIELYSIILHKVCNFFGFICVVSWKSVDDFVEEYNDHYSIEPSDQAIENYFFTKNIYRKRDRSVNKWSERKAAFATSKFFKQIFFFKYNLFSQTYSFHQRWLFCNTKFLSTVHCKGPNFKLLSNLCYNKHRRNIELKWIKNTSSKCLIIILLYLFLLLYH